MNMAIFSKDLGIDLGSSNILIYQAGKGVILREPAVVALDKNSGKVLQVGAAARNMLGRTPGNVAAIHPIRDGVITDFEMTSKLLTELVRRVVKNSIIKPRMIVSVPSSITEVEERAVIQAATEAGARRVYLIEEPLAAGLGANLDVSTPKGRMVVDIGGGTTDIGILSMNAVANSASIKVAGVAFDEAIMKYVRKKYGLVIGRNTAEEAKHSIGCVYDRPDRLEYRVKGRNVKNGLAGEVVLSGEDMLEALRRPARQIVERVLDVLETSTPELVSDIAENGIVLTGGGSRIYGMDRLLQEWTQMNCMVADDADSCVAFGCGRSIAWMNHMQENTINIARRRLLRE
ncbi:MAG: rod shape-determining protein [Oscillospiraceae bacterium]|nr:rod shape-determining protein [Oscillospiraceae bacterium]